MTITLSPPGARAPQDGCSIPHAAGSASLAPGTCGTGRTHTGSRRSRSARSLAHLSPRTPVVPALPASSVWWRGQVSHSGSLAHFHGVALLTSSLIGFAYLCCHPSKHPVL